MKKINKLVLGGILSGVSVILAVLIHFPIIPGAGFLLYDPADIPILIGGFMLGPAVGAAMAFVVSVLMAVFTGQGGPIGALMHFLSTGTLVIVASYIYMQNRTRRGAVLGMLAGSVGMVLIMAVGNLILTPIYMGVPREVVWGMLLPAIIPFNVLKAGINSVFTFLIYKKVSQFLRSIAD